MSKRILRKQAGDILRALRKKKLRVSLRLYSSSLMYVEARDRSYFKGMSAAALREFVRAFAALANNDYVQRRKPSTFIWNVPVKDLNISCGRLNGVSSWNWLMATYALPKIYDKHLSFSGFDPPLTAKEITDNFDAASMRIYMGKNIELLAALPCKSDGTLPSCWLDVWADLATYAREDSNETGHHRDCGTSEDPQQ